MTAKSAFLIAIAIQALRKTARRIADRANPSGDTPGKQYEIWLYHTDGQAAYIATCETRRAALKLDNCLRQATEDTPFYTKLLPNRYIVPPDDFTNGAAAFILERDDFRYETDGFSTEFIASFNSRLSSFTSPRRPWT